MEQAAYRLLAVAAMAGLSVGIAFGGDEGKRRGGGDEQRGMGNMMQRGGRGEGAMIEKAGKLYVISGATLARVDVKTFKVETRVDLGKAGRTAEQEEEEREAWIARFDENGDKMLNDQDARTWRWMRRFDRNGDNQVTANEAVLGPAPGASGPALLKVVDGHLVMLRAGTLFKFDMNDLKLVASEKVELPVEQPGRQPRRRPAAEKPKPAE